MDSYWSSVWIVALFFLIPFILFTYQSFLFCYRIYRFIKKCICINWLYEDFKQVCSYPLFQKHYKISRLNQTVKFSTIPEGCTKLDELIDDVLQYYCKIENRISRYGEVNAYRENLLHIRMELRELSVKSHT